MSEACDVVVIGSGAGGAPVAHTLAAAGHRVIVLEKGPRRRKTDFLHDEISMCRRDYFVPYTDDDPHTIRRHQSHAASPTREGWISQCVGGGTVHMSGFFFRFHPVDFRLVSEFGPIAGSTAIDWPIDYATLAPYYDRVEKLVGVSGDTSANPHAPPRAGPFPYPPVLTHPVSGWIDRAARGAGMHAFAVPRAIITKPSDGRTGCVYCALCGSYGCEVDAKSSTAASLIPAAEATGRCEVRPGAMVTAIVARNDGQGDGVEYLDQDGTRRTLKARAIVVAASAIESARLLLLSQSERYPAGLGNAHGQVGKNLCFSTLGQVTGRFAFEDFSEAQVETLRTKMPFVGRAVQDFYRVDGTGFGKGGTFHLLWEHPNPIHAAERLVKAGSELLYGEKLMKRMREHFTRGRSIEVECFSEWLPTDGCHVDLDDKTQDRFGLPAARININRHPTDRSASALLVNKAKSLLDALGCRDVRTLDVGGETLVLQHGTCRMGSDPKTSVTTVKGNVHGVDNVFVADGGSLPTGGAVPSTLTIMANSFRIAESIDDFLRA